MTKKGWKQEPARHALARRGIKTRFRDNLHLKPLHRTTEIKLRLNAEESEAMWEALYDEAHWSDSEPAEFRELSQQLLNKLHNNRRKLILNKNEAESLEKILVDAVEGQEYLGKAKDADSGDMELEIEGRESRRKILKRLQELRG
jgi:ABC-type nitrate/sulfonate/bicarbonate transport system substrate-binding protein